VFCLCHVVSICFVLCVCYHFIHWCNNSFHFILRGFIPFYQIMSIYSIHLFICSFVHINRSLFLSCPFILSHCVSFCAMSLHFSSFQLSPFNFIWFSSFIAYVHWFHSLLHVFYSFIQSFIHAFIQFIWFNVIVTEFSFYSSIHYMSFHVMSCHFMSYHFMSCHFMSGHVVHFMHVFMSFIVVISFKYFIISSFMSSIHSCQCMPRT
jgi:hypothetical protein